MGCRAVRATYRCSRILAQVVKSNRWWYNEKYKRNARKHSQSLGEILGSLHLGDEGGEQDLRDPEESDVENSLVKLANECLRTDLGIRPVTYIHTPNPRRTGRRESVCLDFAKGWVVAVVAIQRRFLDACKDEEE